MAYRVFKGHNEDEKIQSCRWKVHKRGRQNTAGHGWNTTDESSFLRLSCSHMTLLGCNFSNEQPLINIRSIEVRPPSRSTRLLRLIFYCYAIIPARAFSHREDRWQWRTTICTFSVGVSMLPQLGFGANHEKEDHHSFSVRSWRGTARLGLMVLSSEEEALPTMQRLTTHHPIFLAC